MLTTTTPDGLTDAEAAACLAAQEPYELPTHSSGCWLPDMDNNVKRIQVASNSFTGTFTIQVVANGISSQAVLGLDGGRNQDWTLFLYNAY